MLVFRRVEYEVDREALQRNLDQLADWAKKWQLRFNIEKCQTMRLGGIRERRASYNMERPDGQRVVDTAGNDMMKLSFIDYGLDIPS